MTLAWLAVFDPDETKDYNIFWDAEMNATADTLASATFTLPNDAIAAALTVQSQGVDVTGKRAFVWFHSTNPSATSALAGTKVPVKHTVITDGGRTLQETVFLKVKEK